jgi:hypothetical protein
MRNSVPGDWNDRRWKDPKGTKYQEYYQGLKVHCVNRRVLNPTEPIPARVNPNNRKVWLAALRNFRRALLVKARMGVIDTIMGELSQLKTTTYNHGRERDEVLAAIKSGAVTNEFITSILRGIRAYTRDRMTGLEVAERILSVIRNNSVQFRREFGVFGDA